MLWEKTSLLGQVYDNILLPAASGTNMNADILAVLEILRAHPGQSDIRGKVISEMYRWRGPELGVEQPHA